ncbi:MAG: hypothetical protein AAGD06_13265 [Acidobacteriota bacterium]
MPKSQQAFARRLAPVLLCAATTLAGAVVSAQTAPRHSEVPAPTHLYPEPNVSGLITLPGDFAHVRYGVGYLGRAARLQLDLEPAMRILQRWTDNGTEVTIYLLSREQWQQAGLSMPFGVPVRVGRLALAAPAEGDDATVALWNSVGLGVLPSPAANAFPGTPHHASSMVMADFLTYLQTAEVLVDEAGLAGDEHWVRSLVTHIAAVGYLTKNEDPRLRDLEMVYRQALTRRPERSLAASDYRPDLGLGDWLWFQAHFHRGAMILLDEEGRRPMRDLHKLKNRNDGLLTGASILARWNRLEDWYYDSFSTISTRPASP